VETTELHPSIQKAAIESIGTARSLNAMIETATQLQSQLDAYPFFGRWRVVLQQASPDHSRDSVTAPVEFC